MNETVDTFFAPADRASSQELYEKLCLISNDPVVDGVLHTAGGLLAILDEHRQVLALNDVFLRELGIDNASEALGLRPGEALGCVYAEAGPGGCGTSQYCSTCGAVLAILSTLSDGQPAEKICTLTAKRGDQLADIVLSVRTQQIVLSERKFLLIFLQDITKDYQRASVERIFFHDLNNMLAVISGSSELLLEMQPSRIVNTIHLISQRMRREVELQQALLSGESAAYSKDLDNVHISLLRDELWVFCDNHPAATNKIVEISPFPDLIVKSDHTILLRILVNMAINALEAANENDTVRIWVEQQPEAIVFKVWNAQVIPEEVARRIFQRNFSTKTQAGRGIGTYSMKILGERFLHGKVAFNSTEKEGTVFSFSHPYQKKI